MSDSTKLLFVWLLTVIVIILLGSCNPVKKVLNNKEKFEIVAKEVVRRGYCINDTVIIDTSRIDTVVKENHIVDSVFLDQDIDTTFPSGAKVSLHNGMISVKCPSAKEITRTVKETQYIRDLKLESILKEDAAIKSDSIKYLEFTIQDLNVTIKDKNVIIAKEKAKFIVLIVVLLVFLGFYIYSKYKLL